MLIEAHRRFRHSDSKRDGVLIELDAVATELIALGDSDALAALTAAVEKHWVPLPRVEPRSAQRARWEERGEHPEEHCEERDDGEEGGEANG